MVLNGFILEKCFAESCDSSDPDDFFDTVHTDALDAGVRIATFLAPMLWKLAGIRLD